MKPILAIFISCILLNLSYSQNQSNKFFQKTYIEAAIGGFLLNASGASTSIGFQFHPMLGLGLSTSIYKDYHALYPKNWYGWGMHYRGQVKNIVFQAGYYPVVGYLNKIEEDLSTLELLKESNYLTVSLFGKFNHILLGFQISQASMKFKETCTICVPQIREYERRPIAIVPSIGVSFGGGKR